MRAAAIFGLGTSPLAGAPFQAASHGAWQHGLPAHADDADAILLFGGDGTIHRHLPALVRLQLPVLIVPSGSGNDFARALSLRSPQDSLCVWRDFISGRIQPRALDLGAIAPIAQPGRLHYFCSVAGCGLDAAAARRANRMPRWLRAHGGYALAVVPLLRKLPAFSLHLSRPDGSPLNPPEPSALTLLAAFANTPFYGGGMRIAPNADPSDGQLDVCRIRSLPPHRLLSVFPSVYFGRHLRLREVEYARAASVRVQTESAHDIYADGEFVCETPADISIVRAALPLLLPAWPMAGKAT
jgi:diacylglycerol kinase (ATP)